MSVKINTDPLVDNPPSCFPFEGLSTYTILVSCSFKLGKHRTDKIVARHRSWSFAGNPAKVAPNAGRDGLKYWRPPEELSHRCLRHSHPPLSSFTFFKILTILQCDQLDPACSQCKRAGKECTGYRDQLALLFRNENAKVVRKARAPSTTSTTEKRKAPRKPKRSNEPSPTSSSSLTTPLSPVDSLMLTDSPWGSELSIISRESTPLCSSVPLPFEDLGIHFFFTHYVTVVSDATSGQIEPAFAPMWASTFVDKTFYDAISSVGFAGLSNVTKDRSHMAVARNKYVITLRRINAALQDPENMDLADTFKSVLLLAAFEVLYTTKFDLSNFANITRRLLVVIRQSPGLCTSKGGRHC